MVVETTDREQPLGDVLGHEVDDRGPFLGIVTRRHDLARLVHQQVTHGFRPGEQLAVHLDVVTVGIGLGSELDHGTVDPDTTLADQVLRVPARADTRLRDQLLDTLLAHAFLLGRLHGARTHRLAAGTAQCTTAYRMLHPCDSIPAA